VLDWLEYILGLVTAAGETGEELPQSLIPHSFALPLRQGEEEHAAAEPADIPLSAAYIPLLPALLQGRQEFLMDIPEQAARRSGAGPISLPDSGLPLLYRRTEEAVSRTALAGVAGVSAAEQERIITVREPDSTPAGLTARELDRTVRRDSRRFDGGMNLY